MDSNFLTLLEAVRPAVDRQISEQWERELAQRSREGSALEIPLRAAQQLCSRGGKRLRAGLVAAAYRACEGQGAAESEPAVLSACTAVELLQSYFLIHDDWMDGDLVRRGGPAVHARLKERWPSEHLSAAGGVLAGDYTLALATRVLAGTAVEAEKLPALMDCFARMQLEAVSGQLLDVLDAQPDIERVYELKTGSYTVVGPLQLGGILAGAGADWFSELTAFGNEVGVAFQLQDDLIGMLAPEDKSGKPRGSDLKSGKQTLLYREVCSRVAEKDRVQLQEAFGNSSLGAEPLGEALAIVEASGAVEVIRQRIQSLVLSAQQRVKLAGELSAEARQLLLSVADALARRSC